MTVKGAWEKSAALFKRMAFTIWPVGDRELLNDMLFWMRFRFPGCPLGHELIAGRKCIVCSRSVPEETLKALRSYAMGFYDARRDDFGPQKWAKEKR